MELFLASGNKHKLEEIQALLANFGVTVKRAQFYEKIEPKDWDIEEVAQKNAKLLAEKNQKPILVDDSGLFFAAYNNFPGALPKWAFQTLGYEGLLKLLEGKDRSATFKSALGLCLPGKEPVVFTGEMKGTISTEVFDLDLDLDQFPYERIFIAEGCKTTLSRLTREEKNALSHRGNALRKVAQYLKGL